MKCMQINLLLHPQIGLATVEDSEKWFPLAPGLMKLNCDGSVNNLGRSVGSGGVLRDHDGRFIFAYSSRLEPCTVTEAELQEILQGIRLAWNNGYRHLIVETDSSAAVDLLIRRSAGNHNLHRVIRELLEVGCGELLTEWKKISRHCNLFADTLARFSKNCRDTNVIFNFVSDFLVNSLVIDGCGLDGSEIR